MTTSLSPDARRIWRAARAPVVVAALVLAAAVVMALFRSSDTSGTLAPDSVDPDGSRAIANLLRDAGVTIHPVGTAEAAHDELATGAATLLITQPDWVDPATLSRLRDEAAATVAIGATDDALKALAPSVNVLTESATATTHAPGCANPAARAAGTASLGGVVYDADNTCYDGTLATEVTTTLLGSGQPLTNDALAQEGNAALAMRLLGRHRTLVWYIPAADDPARGTGDQSVYALVPQGWWFGLGQAAIAIALLMLWRGRRLGPVVPERLPVVVRAAETTEGRARLYRRAHATDHAAEALRRATIDRLIPLLGLTSDATQESIIDGLAARTGRATTEVHTVLFGPPPGSEQDLVRLADQLDQLAREAGTPR